jgi:hypothetical protein
MIGVLGVLIPMGREGLRELAGDDICGLVSWQQELKASSHGDPNWKVRNEQPTDMEPATRPSLQPSQQSLIKPSNIQIIV